MILDSIIEAAVAIVMAIAELTALLVVPTINLCFAVVELVVGLFVSGFTITRLEKSDKEARSRLRAVIMAVFFLIGAGLLVGLVVGPKIMNREVTLVAVDGHTLPLAGMVIHSGDEDDHRRTDPEGNITIPRFSTTALTLKDPRYVEQRWEKSEIESELVVQRTVLGAGLDSLAEKLLKPAKE